MKTVPIILEKSIKLDLHGMINKVPGPKAYETVGIYWTYAAFAAACAYFSFITPQIWRTFGQG